MMITTAITLIYAAKIQLFTDTHAYIINYSSESDDYMTFMVFTTILPALS